MAKTSKQIQGDVYQMLKNSLLGVSLSGKVYREGYRPRDSRLEDAVVIFTTGLPDQIQTGVVVVNIFVPDIDPYNNGVMVENGARTEQIEALAESWVESLTTARSNYKFRLAQTIMTDEEPSIAQHFVTVRLRYEYFNE